MSFSGTDKVWMNGKFVEWANANIHVASHVVHYGSAVFEGIRSYKTETGSAVFRLDAHMRRLYDSMRIYRMEHGLERDAFGRAIVETIQVNRHEACYIRPVVYRGYHTLGVNPLPCPVEAAILVWKWESYFGADVFETGVDVCVSSWQRNAPNTTPAMAKSVANYANSALIKMEAALGGFVEGIALDTNGLLSEGSGQNLFLVRDEVIYTPQVASSVLQGITRDSVLTLAQDLGFTVRELAMPREMLYAADEVFFVGTAVEITPIRSIDKIVVGEGRRGPVTTALQTAFFDYVSGRTPDRHNWLTPVAIPTTKREAAAAR